MGCCRISVLPAVCRRWRATLKGPSAAWQDVTLQFWQIRTLNGRSQLKPNWHHVTRWALVCVHAAPSVAIAGHEGLMYGMMLAGNVDSASARVGLSRRCAHGWHDSSVLAGGSGSVRTASSGWRCLWVRSAPVSLANYGGSLPGHGDHMYAPARMHDQQILGANTHLLRSLV